ncbi:MAG: Ppx/GppA phosphatase family protein, partial [Gaiellaceae bacterium]
MRVAIVDVGANTLRLLVAGPSGQQVVPLHVEREALGLGEEIERYGYITAPKSAEAAEVARALTRRARRLGCERVEIIVTSPGRQSANGDEFAELLSEAAGVRARVLSAEEEGALAWDGAVAALDEPPESIAVCDIGGGSTQIAVGTLESGPAWVRSVDLGSLRLTERFLTDDPPSAK